MRRTIIIALSLLILMATMAGTASALGTTKSATKSATANIVPVVAGATETASVQLRAAGSGFTVNGDGTGFNLLTEYVSLAYGRNSVPVQTGGTPPCADDGTLGAPAESTLRMFVGAWLPIIGSNRTLAGAQLLNGLDNINTISIRRANVLGLTQLLIAGDIRPQVFQIRSCGLVTDRVSG
ncbi:MAG: hypothetical protein ACRDSR_03380 [Pseudonocardiaceae bacterium]